MIAEQILGMTLSKIEFCSAIESLTTNLAFKNHHEHLFIFKNQSENKKYDINNVKN